MYWLQSQRLLTRPPLPVPILHLSISSWEGCDSGQFYTVNHLSVLRKSCLFPNAEGVSYHSWQCGIEFTVQLGSPATPTQAHLFLELGNLTLRFNIAGTQRHHLSNCQRSVCLQGCWVASRRWWGWGCRWWALKLHGCHEQCPAPSLLCLPQKMCLLMPRLSPDPHPIIKWGMEVLSVPTLFMYHGYHLLQETRLLSRSRTCWGRRGALEGKQQHSRMVTIPGYGARPPGLCFLLGAKQPGSSPHLPLNSWVNSGGFLLSPRHTKTPICKIQTVATFTSIGDKKGHVFIFSTVYFYFILFVFYLNFWRFILYLIQSKNILSIYQDMKHDHQISVHPWASSNFITKTH